MIQKTTAADGSPPYVAVCYFRRQAGNRLESGELSGNMQTRLYSRLVQFMGVSCNGICPLSISISYKNVNGS